MSDEEQALVRAICAAPFDDLPRLVYADWLEERGESERSEFIRNQIEWSVTKHDHYEIGSCRPTLRCHACDLEKRDRELMRCSFIQEQLPQGESWVINWERGFVSRIECTLAQFLGEMCIGCGGTRTEYYDGAEHTCVICNGTGRTPGLVDTLFQCQPIEAVTISDREPYQMTHGVCWLTANSHHRRDEIPNAITSHFQKKKAVYKVFPTRADAIAALARACVAIGRKRAGLPPLAQA